VSKPFDATVKDLLEAYPADWPECFGLPRPTSVEIIAADLATITTEADKVLHINGATPSLLHLEMQANYDPQLNHRILRYNVLLNGRHSLPVHSAIVLLRPEADGPGMTGHVQHRHGDGNCYLDFRYHIIRVWQRPVESFLSGGLGTLPLAPISAVTKDELPAVIRRMEERLTKEAKGKAARLWSAAYILMGLRYPSEWADQLMSGVRAMEESSTYQAILAKGREQGIVKGIGQGAEQGEKRLLLRQCRKRFGELTPEQKAAIEAISDLDQIEALGERILEVSSWEELMGLPQAKRRNGKRRKTS
jgi:predicted transposase YdaD